MSAAPQADQEVVNGIVQGIVQKAADKWQIEVNVGQQNPRRLWTKDPELVQQMMGMIGQSLSFMCGVSHWTNNQNQAIRSLWINGYGAPGSIAAPPVQPVMQQPVMQQPVQQFQPQAQQGSPATWPPQQPFQPVTQQPVAPVNSTEDKIHRQTATKVAVHLLKHLTPEQQTFDNLIKISERLVGYYENGVQWPVQDAPGAGVSGDPGPQGIPLADDEIPF
jgi:hypothetical protein